MKPISLRFCAFGAYREEQYVDFSRFEENGVFLITGPTGSGKTTLLDAICFALYYVPSGGERGDLFSMRCKSADLKSETFVEFEFESSGKRYRFRRSVNEKGRDKHNCEVYRDGGYASLESNPKQRNVTAHAERIIGLDEAQFRQVIMLPQGQSEKLLTSSSKDKQAILNDLFLTNRWSEITAEIRRRVDAHQKELQKKADGIAGRLRICGCSCLDELRQLCQTKQQELDGVSAQAAEAEEEKKRLDLSRTQAAAMNERFVQLDRLREKYEALRQEWDGREQEEALLGRAEKALEAEPKRNAYLEKKTAAGAALAELAAAEKRHGLCRASAESAAEKLKAHNESGAQAAERAALIPVYESRRAAYKRCGELRSAAENAHRTFSEAEKKLNKTKAAEEGAFAQWQDANNSVTEISRERSAVSDAYIRGCSGRIARDLVEGEPCPVCGSRSHPNPAKPDETSVSEEELDRLNKALEAAVKKVEEKKSLWESAKAASEAVKSEYDSTQTVLTAAETALSEAEKERIEGIDDLAALEEQTAALKREAREYSETAERLKTACEKAENDMSGAAALLEKAGESLSAAQEAEQTAALEWNSALAEKGFSDESDYAAAYLSADSVKERRAELTTLEARYLSAKEAYAAEKEKLAGTERPDMDRLNGEFRRLQEAEKALTETRARLSEQVNRLKESLGELISEKAAYDEEKTLADADENFSDAISSAAGVNLPRFVIAAMLDAVVERANRMMTQVLDGRYELFRTDERTGSKQGTGLELAVYDSVNGRERFVKSLSGGEKFIVSLCFAIAVSAVVQEQGKGVNVEAMFIDEGFGTLDKDRTNDALRILAEVKENHALVGVISHVDMLSENIPAKLTVVEDREHATSFIKY